MRVPNPADLLHDRLPCACAAVAVAGCLLTPTPLRAGEPAARNILLVSFDTTRTDRLSAYGYGQPTSPALESLASEGVSFERAYTHVPSTLPAHSTIFTGRYPASHGVRCNGKFALPAAETTVAEILKEAGFATGAVVGGFPLDPRFGIAQGFDHYDADFSATSTSRSPRGDSPDGQFWIGHGYPAFERPAAQVTDRAIRWLSSAEGRWFLFAHYFDPHAPYEPPAATADKFADPYDAEIAAMDAAFGTLLNHVKTMPGPTLVVVTADHGEGLGDHGEPRHNRYLYDTTLRVPLVLALEGVTQAGSRVAHNVAHVDLLPTMLELAGLPRPGGIAGRSLVPALTGAAFAERPVFAETLVWSLERPDGIAVRALIDGREKVIRTDHDGACTALELYDRAADAAELSDQSATDPRRAAALASQLAAMQAELDLGATPAEPFDFDDETEARLKSLGYL